MRNLSVRVIFVATTSVFISLLAGCSYEILPIEPPTPVTASVQHLEALKPKLATHHIQPMYKLEALGFTAVDETGWDWAGSDEIYAVWRSYSPLGSNTQVSTKIVDDVDSGDHIDFHPLQSCIYPIAGNELFIDGRYGGEGSGWVCRDEGGPGPVGFTVNLFDEDNGAIKLPYCFDLTPGTDCWDSFVGKYNHTWSIQELRDGWLTPGTVKNITVRLNPCEGPAICGDDDFPDYDFHFRITRMPDKEILLVNSAE